MRRLIGIAVLVVVLAGTIVLAAPNSQTNAFQLFILQTRTDLETLANAVDHESFGLGIRPETWTFNFTLGEDCVPAIQPTTDPAPPPTVGANAAATTPTPIPATCEGQTSDFSFVGDLWYDNEQLADAVFGSGTRPPEWFGATTTDYALIARNVRHDLEVMADTVFGLRVRPDGWNGALRIYECDRTLQNFARLLDVVYAQKSSVPETVFDYCATLKQDIEEDLSVIVFNKERELLDVEFKNLFWAARGDLERLANELLGVNVRPATWIGNIELESPTLASDLDRDIETLADFELEGQRPDGWAIVITTSDAARYRSLRYNLELLANATLADSTARPNGWEGVSPLEQCTLIEQGFITAIQQTYNYTFDEAILTSANICDLAVFTANNLAENPPEITQDQIDERYRAKSNYAFAYLDQAALDFMGIMPGNTEFRAWYRNFGESTMMFVSGENFAVYIDLRWTDLDEQVFNSLPTLDGVIPKTFCEAKWCNGPRATPTPTGGGPLMAVINQTTPQATISVDIVGAAKTQVSWNHIRVTYLLDRPETGTVQVALEICNEPTQTTCEPVVSVYDNSIGAAKPVLSQYGSGLNVFELRYGYNGSMIVEGTTLVSPDIWVSDPAIR